MNKFIFYCVFGLLMTTTMRAQESGTDFKRNELRGGVGLWSSNDLISSYSDLFSTALTGGAYSVSNDRSLGNYSLTYRRALNTRLSIGGTLAYSLLKSDVNFDGKKSGTVANNYLTAAPEVEYKYLNMKNFRLYGFAGAGLTVNRQKLEENGKATFENSPFFNFQVSPLCAQVGNKFGFYVEAGFGYNGIINAGLFARF